MGAAEDQRINASNNLKFLHMKERESVCDYITRARGFVSDKMYIARVRGIEVTSR